MKRRFSTLAVAAWLVLGGIAAAAPAGNQQVYTWVDKNGVRHYADHPDSPNAQKVSVQTAPGASHVRPAAAPVKPATNAPVPRTIPPAPVASESKAQRQARCATLRRQVKELQSARRVRVKQGGKTRYVSGKNLSKFRRNMHQRMQTACKTPSS